MMSQLLSLAVLGLLLLAVVVGVVLSQRSADTRSDASGTYDGGPAITTSSDPSCKLCGCKAGDACIPLTVGGERVDDTPRYKDGKYCYEKPETFRFSCVSRDTAQGQVIQNGTSGTACGAFDRSACGTGGCAAGQQRLCKDGRLGVCVGTDACAFQNPQAGGVYQGASCQGLRRLSQGEPSRGNFVGCSGAANCFCGGALVANGQLVDPSGTVSCYTDLQNDSCGAPGSTTTVTTTPPTTTEPPVSTDLCRVEVKVVLPNFSRVNPPQILKVGYDESFTLRAVVQPVSSSKPVQVVNGVRFRPRLPIYVTPTEAVRDTTAPFEQTYKPVLYGKGGPIRMLAQINNVNTDACVAEQVYKVVNMCNLVCNASLNSSQPLQCGPSGKYFCYDNGTSDTSDDRCRIPAYPKSDSCTPPAPNPSPSPTPPATPPTTNCNLCQYQADLFWGPVIESFKSGGSNQPGPRYGWGLENTPYFRLMTAVTDKGQTNANTACSLTSTTYKPVTVPLPGSGCERPIESGKLSGTIDRSRVSSTGYLYGTVKNNSTSCSYQVGLATYKANWTNPRDPNVSVSELEAQNLFNHQVLTVGPGQTVSLKAKMPTVSGSNTCYQ